MKPLIPILVVATTSLAVASVQFANQASDQRKRVVAEVQLRQKQDARIAELERDRARLEHELAVAREQSAAAPPAPVAAAPRPAGARPPPASATFAVAEAPAPGMPPPRRMGMRGFGPFESAAGRTYMQARLKTQLRRTYGDAAQALGLSADKGNQLIDLLADQQARNFGGIRDKVPEGQSIQQYMQEQQKKNNDEIMALIGQDKADEWAAYQQSLPDRAQLGVVRDQLEQAGVPMTDSQRTQMLAAITEESQRLPRPTPSQGLPPEETAAQFRQWQSEYDEALLDRAKQVLNTEQYDAYKVYQDWQTEVRNNLPRGPNGVPGGGMVIRSVNGVPGVAVSGPVVNFGIAAPAQPMPAPTEAPRR